MSDATSLQGLERLLASVYRHGTRIATGVVALGLVVAGFTPARGSGARAATIIIEIGLILFILLPTARVALMLVAFLRGRDYRFATASAFVLAIIVAGFVAAAYMPVR